MVCREVIGHYDRSLIGRAETDAGTVVGETLRDNAALVINNPADRRLTLRVGQIDNAEINSLICTPVKYRNQWLGALEVLNKRDGSKFGNQMSSFSGDSYSSGKLMRNAQRHEAERKVKSCKPCKRQREIISSLDLNRVLAVVVNQVATIIPFDRCAIA
jgi:hypothetical protein